jgi:CheY-like chemotaxis protein
VVDVSPEPAKIVLVVDDEEQVRKLTCRILQRAGYIVLSARSGPEALAMFRSGDPVDLVFTDVEMNGMSGIELARQMRAERPDAGVLLSSANLAHATESELPFLAKPFLPKDLLSFVAGALAKQMAPAAVQPPVAEPLRVPDPVVVAHAPQRRRQSLAAYLLAAGFVLALIPLGLHRITAPGEGSADTVNLRTWRGLAGSTSAKPGRSLVLNLNLTGIAPHDSYRIELVDLNGQVIWQQVIPNPRKEILQARSAALHAGLYYVRASASPEGLLREYELHIGENQ